MSQKYVAYKKQARKMIIMVYNFIKSDAETNNLSLTAKELEQKTANATKASLSSVRMIIEGGKDNNSSVDYVSTGRKRPRPQKPSNLSLLEQGQIKRTIHNFHETENEILTIEKLMKKLDRDINYEGSEKSLRGTIKGLGFRWKTIKGDKRLLIEKTEIRYQRIEYLKKLRNYRQEGRNIVYAHNTFIRPKQPVSGPKKSTAETYYYMGFFSASTNSTIIPDTILVFSTTKADYDDHFYRKYEEWIKNHLVSNIPEKSVVVVSSAKYHNREYEVTPMSCAPRSEMVTWLEEKGIKFDKHWLKPQLYGLIKTYKAKNKIFLIDKLLNYKNHSVLRIPICHPDLSPLEIAWESWDDIKSHINIKDKNELNIKNVVIKKINDMEMEFKKICKNIKDIEQSYRRSDYVIDMLTEEFKFYNCNSSDDDVDDDELDYEGDSDGEVKVKIERLE